MMTKYVCSSCGAVLWLDNEDSPGNFLSDLKPGEFFENHCPGCDSNSYFSLEATPE